MRLVSKPSSRLGSAQGPASALGEYLTRLGMQMAPNGDIQVNAYLTLNILEHSYAVFAKYFRWAWEDQLLMTHTNREKLYNFPAIDKHRTCQVLATLPFSKQLLMVREIAGNFQTAHQKSTWNSDFDDECQWCGHEGDTRQHRLLFCSAFHSHREPFHEAVQQVIDTGGDFAELPVIFKHPHYDFHDAIHMKMPRVTIEPQNLPTLLGHEGFRNYYTDGSCQFPSQPSLRYAAFSVVVDLAVDDTMRRAEARAWRGTGILPHTLHKLCAAPLSGPQTIHRAEAEAILTVVKLDPAARIFSDSACSLQKCWNIQAGSTIFDFASHADFDQLRELVLAVTPQHVFTKIKAHVDPHTVQDDLQLYHTLGNFYADQLANQANQLLHPQLVTEWNHQHATAMQQREQYEQLCNLVLALQTARSQAAETTPSATKTVQATVQPLAVLTRTFSDQWLPAEQWDEEWLQYSVWGHQMMFTAVTWLRELHWPLAPPAKPEAGVSWVEIAMSMATIHNNWLPVKRVNSGGTYYVKHFSSVEAAVAEGLDLSEQAETAAAVIKQLKSLVPQKIMPDWCGSATVQSLYLQGFARWTTGLAVRPIFPEQAQIQESLRQYLQLHPGKLKGLPSLNLGTDYAPWPEDAGPQLPWQDQQKRLTRMLVQVRRRRRLLSLAD